MQKFSRTGLMITLLLMAVYSKDTTEKRLKQLEEKVNAAMAKAGISFGGEFRSQYFLSHLGGEAADTSKRTIETNEFTSVDFDITARPVSNVEGRLILRMHQNWQNFFSDISNPVFSRWISIDATGWDVIRFNAGDFKAKFSPLTLYAPQIDMLYEPEIFSRQRNIAMDELFLGNNNRILQGLNFGFDAEIYPLFDEFHFALLGTRLRNVETSIQNGSKVANVIEFSPVEKIATGANLDTRFLKSITLGGTYIYIFDHKGSMEGSDTTVDTTAQRTGIAAGRAGIDVAPLLELDRWNLGVSAEIAMSSDDSTRFDTVSGFTENTISGTALDIKGSIGYSMKERFYFDVTAGLVRNEPDFRNELAQSPTFVGERIMNIENDSVVGGTFIPQFYSSYDAMYHTVFKFTPSQGTNRWHKAPFMKNSYTHSIFTRDELNRLRAEMDPSLQLVMPFGPATPNRNGITGKIGVGFSDYGIEVKGLFDSFDEIDGMQGSVMIDATTDSLVDFPATAFSRFGGGGSFDLSALAKVLPFPLRLSGSFVRAQADNDGPEAFSGNNYGITSDFTNLGLYYKFWKRTALLGGVQINKLDFTQGDSIWGQKQLHFAGGFQWTVSPGADVVFSLGQIAVTNTNDDPDVDAGAMDFEQFLVDVSLDVVF
ncbi:MAG: hypothetical protein GF401_16090 [Chitinivibrionales bacterium]|nr:hypothetical protein [Chitinivibrionales bacterium]